MGSSDKGELTASADRVGLFTSNSKQLIPYVDGRLILVLVHGILPPVFEQLLHPMSKSSLVFVRQLQAQIQYLTYLLWLQHRV